MAAGEADRHPERAREDPPPEVAPGEAAGRADLADLAARVAHRGEHERELLADALERGADEVLAAGARA